VRWEGALWVEEPGDYTVFFGTDDGQRLYLDGELIAAYYQGHALFYVSGTRYLIKGWHPITLEMFEGGGNAEAKLEWEGPGIDHEMIPADRLGHVQIKESIDPPTIVEVAHNILNLEDDAPGFRLRWSSDKIVQADVVYLGKSHTFETWSTSFSYNFTDVPFGSISLEIRVTDQNGVVSEPYPVGIDIPEPAE
jgi:hypothetical protein